MKKAFLSPSTGLLRSGWRIMAFFVIFFAMSAGGMIAVRTILGQLKRGSTLQFTILAIAATLAVIIARKLIDRRSVQSLGLKFDRLAILDLLYGIINSALLMGGMFFVLQWLGLIQFNGFTWWTDGSPGSTILQLSAIPVVIAVFYELALVAWWEELVFRGYFFQNLVAGTGLKWGIVISSLVFGFGHAFNPDATILTSLLIALVTPQLIYAYLKTGQLWLPMGLHLGWNFFQASVFGFAASGQDSPSLISQTPTGPDWLSGGAFGAEGSVLIVPFTLLSMVLIHFWVQASRRPAQKSVDVAIDAAAA